MSICKWVSWGEIYRSSFNKMWYKVLYINQEVPKHFPENEGSGPRKQLISSKINVFFFVGFK
jgi:hypothetical protein